MKNLVLVMVLLLELALIQIKEKEQVKTKKERLFFLISFFFFFLVVGVFQENLWFQLDDEKGRVSYWGALRTYEDAKAKDITVIQEDYDIHYLTYYEFEALAHSECEKQYSSFDPNSNRSLVFPEPPFQFSSYLKEALARPFKSRRIVRSKNSTHLPILSNNDGNNNNNPDVLDIIAALPIELVREIAKLLTPLQLFIILFVSKVWYKRFSDPLM